MSAGKMTPNKDTTIEYRYTKDGKDYGSAFIIKKGWFDKIPDERKIAIIDAILYQVNES